MPSGSGSAASAHLDLALWTRSGSTLRWFGLALNGLMIAATPIDGSHYFIDVFAGLTIASYAGSLRSALRTGPRPIPVPNGP